MAEKNKVEAGHYEYNGFDVVYEEDEDLWKVYDDYRKVTEVEVDSFPRMKDCLEFIDDYEPPESFDEQEQSFHSGRGEPVFVVTDDFLSEMKAANDPEYLEAKDMFKEAVKDEQNRIRIIFLAIIRRKVDKLEKMDMFTKKAEEKISKNLDKYSPEQLMEFYETISKRMNQESQEIGKIFNSL